MRESVRKTQHPWLVGVAVVAIAGTYFALLGSSEYPEPGANLVYDIQDYIDLDNIETRFEEKGQIHPGVESPRAMAVGARGLYVAGSNAVVLFGADDQEIARYPVEGEPNCLGVAPDGTLFVGLPTRVQVLRPDGTPEAVWAEAFAERSYLTSIAAGEADVYVADAGKRVVYRFDRQGALLVTIGEADPDRDVPGFEVPSPYLDLALNDEGNLWVVNPGKLGLERYRENGDIVTSWYRPTLELEGFSGCCNPTQIAFSKAGKLITCEKGLVRVKIYDVTSGEFEELVAGSKLFPKEQSVRDIAVDAQDRILVLDPRIDAIRIFALKETVNGSEVQPA